MKSIMTKADLFKMLEPLSDTDIVQCQVNYTTSRTDEAFSQYNHTHDQCFYTEIAVWDALKEQHK